MLVLTRKVNESIKIGENIFITVVSIDGEKVRIGLEAPTEYRILRTEVLQNAVAENKRSLDDQGGFQALAKLVEEKKNTEK